MVYIEEAHPTDGRPAGANVRAGVLIAQPTTIQQRAAVADHMCQTMKLSIPVLVDDLQNTVGLAYNARPDRLYLIGEDGRIAYQGERGPQGLRSAELEAAIERILD